MLTDLDDFYCFALVVEHGGFSAAERVTDIPKSKLSRRVYSQIIIKPIQWCNELFRTF